MNKELIPVVIFHFKAEHQQKYCFFQLSLVSLSYVSYIDFFPSSLRKQQLCFHSLSLFQESFASLKETTVFKAYICSVQVKVWTPKNGFPTKLLTLLQQLLSKVSFYYFVNLHCTQNSFFLTVMGKISLIPVIKYSVSQKWFLWY